MSVCLQQAAAAGMCRSVVQASLWQWMFAGSSGVDCGHSVDR